MYEESFSRNIGLLTEMEQRKLRDTRISIAGLGGVGGTYAVTLARLGVGKFHLADFDVFEAANFNRQAGATVQTLGVRKTEGIRKMILDINPEAEIQIFGEGLTPANAGEFLDQSNLVMDGLDFYAIDARRLLFSEAERRKLHVITSGPIGMTTTLHVFGPGSMKFEDYFDFATCKDRNELLAAFLVGVTPSLLQLGQIDFRKVDFQKQKAPSIVTAIQLCGGLACNEAIQILLERRAPFLAPRYFQFNPVRLKVANGRLRFGNRSPLQRLKRKLLLKQLLAGKSPRSDQEA